MAPKQRPEFEWRHANSLEMLVRAYLSTADAGPRGREGIPSLHELDARARRLLEQIDATRRNADDDK
jgi:hypothetical protein